MAKPTAITIEYSALEDFRRVLERAPDRLRAELAVAVTEAILLGQRETVERTPAVSNLTRNSILAGFAEQHPGGVRGSWGSAAPHIAALEHGSRPHFPPISPLMNWARQKFGALDEKEQKAIAFAVATKISKEGTQAKNMFRDATEAIEGDVRLMFEGALRRTADAIERGLA